MLSSLVTGYKVPTKTHGPNRTEKGFCIIYCSRNNKNLLQTSSHKVMLYRTDALHMCWKQLLMAVFAAVCQIVLVQKISIPLQKVFLWFEPLSPPPPSLWKFYFSFIVYFMHYFPWGGDKYFPKLHSITKEVTDVGQEYIEVYYILKTVRCIGKKNLNMIILSNCSNSTYL